VALGVVFALLAQRPRARVVILTHSHEMAGVWAERWSRDMRAKCPEYEDRFDDPWEPCRFRTFRQLRDAYREGAPNVAIGSYETLKKYRTDGDEAAVLDALLRRVYARHSVKLSTAQRRELIREVVPSFTFNRRLGKALVTHGDAHQFLGECFDPETKWWKVSAHHVIDRVDGFIAEHHRERLSPGIDLLIIDEAHKLEGTTRQRVITRLLRKRFHKCLFVTATPFALSVEQFRSRLREFENARSCRRSFIQEVNALPLDAFARAVQSGAPYPGRAELQRSLRRYVIRDSWDHDRERRVRSWTAIAQSHATVPTMLLERVIDAVLAQQGRTHIASRRESLCSSWAAAVRSLVDSPIPQAEDWSRRFRAVVEKAKGGVRPDPKMLAVIDQLVVLATKGEKAVLFTQRDATAQVLQQLLRKRLADRAQELSRQSDYWRRQRDRLAALLGLPPREAGIVAKIIGHSSDAPRRWDEHEVRRWWKRHLPRAFPGGRERLSELDKVVGRGKRLPLVMRYARGGDDEDSHAREKFNLPSAPLILISTPIGQEGIDLHRYCRRVVLYDLTWNPAHMEQRIGRVHRLGGAYSQKKKVEVIYCYQRGTYEEVMARRVQERCKMLHVLLGAGQWLDRDQEIDDVEQYRMSFPPC
jgi:hypothetical protein